MIDFKLKFYFLFLQISNLNFIINIEPKSVRRRRRRLARHTCHILQIGNKTFKIYTKRPATPPQPPRRVIF